MPNEAKSGMPLPMPVRLRDGRAVVVREIGAQDEQEIVQAFERLSAESRYTRFMIPLRELSPRMLAAATHPVPGRDFALVAITGEGGDEDIVAGARYVGGPGSDTCEFAVTVADDWHGAGLARRLMELLIANARERGLRCMEGQVLAVNTPLRRLAKRLGFSDRPCPDDAALRLVSLELASKE